MSQLVTCFLRNTIWYQPLRVPLILSLMRLLSNDALPRLVSITADNFFSPNLLLSDKNTCQSVRYEAYSADWTHTAYKIC